MLGKNHKIFNTVFLASSVGVLYVTDNLSKILLDTNDMYLIPIGLAAFYIGSTLPDIDNKGLFKFLGHRTITHSIYPFILLSVLSYYLYNRNLYLFYFLSALTISSFLHVLADSFSVQGVAWFRPYSGYIKYGAYGKVKKHKIVKLYRTGEDSETMFLIGSVLLMAIIALSFFGVKVSAIVA